MNPAAKPDFDNYVQRAIKEYKKLLSNPDLKEDSYQKFFEENPFFLSRLCTGISGSGVIFDCLISQPRLNAYSPKIPDFLWLTTGSSLFNPIFIEIERPGKKFFKQNGDMTADFFQAFGQLCWWNSILRDSPTKDLLFDTLRIPKSYLDHEFSPQFALVYGRRSEFESDKTMKRMIGSLSSTTNFAVRTFDSLIPEDPSMVSHAANLATCKMKSDSLLVENIPESLGLNTRHRSDYLRWSGFDEAVDNNPNIPSGRKQLLKNTFNEILKEAENKPKDLLSIKPNTWI